MRHLIVGLVALGTVAKANRSLAETIQGPSSSATPYVINVPASVRITSILTVGDSVNFKPDGVTRYRMVGIGDGMGAFDNYDGTFTVLMNHEIPPALGIPREHSFAGAFVSHWIIRKSDLEVLHGGDQIKKLLEWDGAKFVPATRAIGRLCSADLPLPSAFYNRKSGKGYMGRIFMDGEEVGDEGRAFAHIVGAPGAGISYELPYLGKFSWENAVASPYEQDPTVVIGMEDSTPGQVYVYIGKKQDTGNEIQKAGLHGGSLYGIKVSEVPLEFLASQPERGLPIANGTRFSLENLGDVHALTGSQIQEASSGDEGAGVTEFLRPEDGAWDNRNPKVFYFVTTDRYDNVKDGSGETPPQVGRSRLHRLTFDSIENPENGGVYDVLLDGTEEEAHQMLDNMTVDGDGNLIIQEDPGNQERSARIWKYYPRTDALVEIAKHDPARFGDRDGPTTTDAAAPFTQDEESSGVIEITHLLLKNRQGGDWDRFTRSDDEEFDEQFPWTRRGYRYYLGVTQAHPPVGENPPFDVELVERGQLYIIGVPKNVRNVRPRGGTGDQFN
jgi:Bacterial protein of unknown function (DUF839)